MSGREGTKGGSRHDRRAWRRGVVLACFLLAATAIIARAAQLQVVEHERWARAAEDQHREQVALPARRGVIFDRKGVPLALSHEMYQVSLAPPEIREAVTTLRLLAEGLGLPESQLQGAIESDRRWVVLPGRYTAEQRRAVGSVRGVYFERHFERAYPRGDAGREVVGALTRDGRALGGIEQQLDEHLRGEDGYSVLRRDGRGNAQPAISLPVVPPRDGASVYLTIDFEIQEIADAALRDAISLRGASGGDLLIGDPRTGEILAAVSRRSSPTRSLSAVTEPYEPGSTLKPFLVASLLAEGRAALADTVYAERGIWVQGSRTFRDTSPHEWLSLREALQVSSNIALVKFAERLSPGQQYAYLRDFGFGLPTGIEYPAESSGRLRRPSEWSRLSSGSLAMGYEISVTPLQMLAAYSALANGGVLMAPHIVREVRGPDGAVLQRRESREVRRIVPEDVARIVTDVLVEVVEEGTATRASLATFAVAGKTGTTRRMGASGRYEAGSYISTFAGYFPAQDPQIVIFVKLDEPEGEYYGGLTAAPVTRETLQGILAARTPAIDRRTLLATRAGETAAVGRVAPAARVPEASLGGTYVFLLADGAPPVGEPAAPTVAEVPDVVGLSLRQAVHKAHEAGFRVRLEGTGEVAATRPRGGTWLSQGETLVVVGANP